MNSSVMSTDIKQEVGEMAKMILDQEVYKED